MPMRFIFLLGILYGSVSIGLPTPLVAQAIAPNQVAADSGKTFSQLLHKGRFSGHVRSFLMITDNKPGLSDYYALGIGAGIGYQTPRFWKRLELGVSGFFTVNAFSSDLSAKDPKTGQTSRYEVGLFDVMDPKNGQDIDRLQELYARIYLGKKSKLTLGRQLPKSPFINPQDGRMRPTLVEGAVLEWNEWGNTSLQLDYLVSVSPRSTVKWFSAGESIGIYPVGVGVDGKPSQYAGQVKTSGILQAGLTQKAGPVILQLWNTYVPDVFNMAYGVAEWRLSRQKGYQWLLGIQGGYQQAVGHGGNDQPALAYIQPDAHSAFVSGRVEYKTPRWTANLNTTRITAAGRFLMPREWGREPFYTFMFRERNEGTGNTTAITATVRYTLRTNWKLDVAAGYFHLPDVKNYALNKYGLPAYTQVHVGTTYQFRGALDGLDLQLLFMRKDPMAATYESDRYVINKVSMNHINAIINFHF